jgi:hypothetical protein
MEISPLAGKPAPRNTLVDLAQLEREYYERRPDIGDPNPSEADMRLTRRISQAATIVQIQLVDHVIIGQSMNGRQGYFRETGIIA